MKSLEELKKLRDAAKKNLNIREKKDGYRVKVGMATCGIAAGARPVLNKFVESVNANGLDNVMVTQVGCVGSCEYEPIVEISGADGTNVVYAKVTADMVDEIVIQHLSNGKVVDKYTLGSIKK